MRADEHTRLMNMTIGLCYVTRDWAHVLHDCGYSLQVIEQTLRTRSRSTVKPDIIVASSRERHALVIDCKSGRNTKREQEERYGELDTGTVGRWVTVMPALKDHTVAYSVYGHAAERIAPHVKLPLIVFHETHLLGVGKFGAGCLDGALSEPTALEGLVEPTEYYPYGPGDEDTIVSQYVMQGMTRLIRKRNLGSRIDDDETVDSVFKITHRYHESLSDEVSGKIKKKIKAMLKSRLATDERLVRQLEKIREGDRRPSAWAGLSKIFRENLERESRQARLPLD